MIIALSKLHLRRANDVVGSVLRVLTVAKSLLCTRIDRASRSRAVRELQCLDDRMLADIGLQRSELERYIMFGC